MVAGSAPATAGARATCKRSVARWYAAGQGSAVAGGGGVVRVRGVQQRRAWSRGRGWQCVVAVPNPSCRQVVGRVGMAGEVCRTRYRPAENSRHSEAGRPVVAGSGVTQRTVITDNEVTVLPRRNKPCLGRCRKSVVRYSTVNGSDSGDERRKGGIRNASSIRAR